MKEISIEDLEALRIGTWVLGTGGGGNPYHMALSAKLLTQQTGKKAKIIKPEDLADDAVVAMTSFIGAPLVLLERLYDYEHGIKPIKVLEDYIGKKVDALLPMEIGGANGMFTFAIAIALDLPIVDADCMGRAYPEFQMITPAINNEPIPPLVVSDIRNSSVLYTEVESWDWVEKLMRTVCSEMGAVAANSFIFSGELVKRSSIHNTITQALDIGHSLIKANKNNEDPIQTVLDNTTSKLLFEGKVTDVERRIEGGWVKGKMTMKGIGDNADDTLLLHFQNEFSVAELNGEVLITTPDLICVLDTVSGDGVGTDTVRYGQRLSVIGMPSDPIYLAENAIKAVNPRAFGFDIDYKSVF